jgi:protein O-GlcNAc transferase
MNRKQRRAEEKLGRAAPASAPSAHALSLFAKAVAHHQAGRMAEAESLYRQVLAVEPDHAETHHYLGVLAWQIGRADIAEAMIGRAIALKGIEATFHESLGNALRSLGRLDESVASFRRALTLRPDFFEAYVNLGNALKDQGKLDDCAAAYRRAVALRPDAAIAHNNLGSALKDQGKLSDSEASCRKALALKPDYPEAHNNLAVALTDQRRFDEAIASFRQALAFKPDYPNAHYNLGNALWRSGALTEAIAAYERALALKPDLAEAHNNLGAVLIEQGRPVDAVTCFQRALALNRNYAVAHNNLGNALLDQGRLDEATASFERALALKPDYADARSNIDLALADQGKLGDAIDLFEQALAQKPDYTDAHSNLLLAQHYSDRISNAERLAAARRFGERFRVQAPVRNFRNDPSPARVLRIGYVSADFREHPVGYFLTPVLEAHDRAAVEIFCYSNNRKADATTLRLKAASDHWRDIGGVADAEAAQLILRDSVDILVDLSGHTANNRLPLFALQAAPVQASWLGYFGTTGLEAIDYLVMDETSVRPGEEGDYCETIVRLPYGRFCYAPPDYAPAPAAPPLLARGYPTFGSFNNVTKIGSEVIGLWAQTLRAAPRSRLLLKWKSLDDSTMRRGLFDRFAAAGVAPERIELRGFSPHPQMLAQYGDIDVALDPFPFGGGLTSCEALWMGVPVVTLPGDRPASRQSEGFLALVDAGDGIASSPADYVKRAAALAADPARLGELRRALRPRMAASPLCNGALFTPTLEAAFRQMWVNRIARNGGAATGAASMVDAA